MSSLVLASASPQRKTLLEQLCLVFAVVASDFDERTCTETDPVRRAIVLASMKAQDVARGAGKGKWVIGCDTLVVAADKTLLEKPMDAADARRMLLLQGGQTSWVHSGLSLIAPDGREWTDVSSSSVTFHRLTDRDLQWWIDGKFWQDRSGAFQIDGPGQLLIERMEGDWTGIVGLPVYLLGKMFQEAEAPFLH